MCSGLARGADEEAPEVARVPQPTSIPTLALRAVSKQWGDLTVLDEADLEVPAGVSVFLSGRNGSGKTTLMRILAGLVQPDSGTIALEGIQHDVDRPAFQRRLGYVSSGDGGLYARLSVRRNLDVWAGLALIPARRRRAAIDDWIARFGLEPLASRRCDRLSLGQRQRVRLAAAFLHQPRLVLLDEPFASLDDEGVDLLIAALRELTARGGSSLACAPGTREATSFDRRFRLVDGRVRAE